MAELNGSTTRVRAGSVGMCVWSPCIQSISRKMSFLSKWAPMAGRLTHASLTAPPYEAGSQPPKVAGEAWLFRCNPFFSQASKRPSLSVSVTIVLVTMASHVRQIWLSEELSIVDTLASCGLRLKLKVGLAHRCPAIPVSAVPLNGLIPDGGLIGAAPLMVRVSVLPDRPLATIW